jgi:hypothetical protein
MTPRARRDGFSSCASAPSCASHPAGAPPSDRPQSSRKSSRARRPLRIRGVRLHPSHAPGRLGASQTAQNGPSSRVLGRDEARPRSSRDPVHGAAVIPRQNAVVGLPYAVPSCGTAGIAVRWARGPRAAGAEVPSSPAPAAARASPAAAGELPGRLAAAAPTGGSPPRQAARAAPPGPGRATVSNEGRKILGTPKIRDPSVNVDSQRPCFSR